MEDPLAYGVRLATEKDMESVNDIYNYYVATSTCSYGYDSMPIEERLAWWSAHAKEPERYPVLVATTTSKEEGREEVVVGWASLSRYSERPGYNWTGTSSIYLHHDHLGKGLGTRLMEEVIARAKKQGFKHILAGIDTEQEASIALHKKLGFVQAAYFDGIGFKFGRTLSVIWMQLKLES